MKAAVIYANGEGPWYVDTSAPVVENQNGLLVRVKAVAIKHFDKARAASKHYASLEPTENGRVIGGDGVFLLEDGRRVYGIGVSGTLAEKAIIHKEQMVILPPDLDDAVAAALPNAVIGAAMGLRFKAAIRPGDTVLVNGATGFTGRLAVQIAKYYGAKKVIATGRNKQSLEELLALGADETISVVQEEKQFKAQLGAIHAQTPLDIIIDYLWGDTAEWILAALKGNGSFTNRISYVSVGSMAGDVIRLSAANLRSVDLRLSGSGLGAWTRQQVDQLFTEILPDMFQLAVEGRLRVSTVEVKLEDIATLWKLDVAGGQRLVVTI